MLDAGGGIRGYENFGNIELPNEALIEGKTQARAETKEIGGISDQEIEALMQQDVATGTVAMTALKMDGIENPTATKIMPRNPISETSVEAKKGQPMATFVSDATGKVKASKKSILKKAKNFDNFEAKHDISNKAWAASAAAQAVPQVGRRAMKLVNAGKRSMAVLGVIGTSVDTVASVTGTVSNVVSFCKNFKTTKQMNAKMKELKQLKKKEPVDMEKKAQLEREIVELKGQIGTSKLSILGSLLANLSWNIGDALQIAAYAGARIAAAASAIAGGIVYGALMFAVKIKAFVDDYKEVKNIKNEMKECQAKIKDPNVSAGVKEIYQARLTTLEEKVLKDKKLSRMKNFIDAMVSVVSFIQGVACLAFAAAAPWLAIPLALGIIASIAVKIYMDHKASTADERIDKALNKRVAELELSGDRSKLTLAYMTLDIPHQGAGSKERLGDLVDNMDKEFDSEFAALKERVKDDLGLSDVNSVTKDDIIKWSFKPDIKKPPKEEKLDESKTGKKPDRDYDIGGGGDNSGFFDFLSDISFDIQF